MGIIGGDFVSESLNSNIKDNFKKGIKTFFDESKTLMREWNEDYVREVATF